MRSFFLSILSFVVSSAYPTLSLRLKRTPSMRLFVPNLVFKFLFFPSFSHSCFFVTYGCLPIFASRLFCLLSIVKNRTSVFVLFIHNLHFFPHSFVIPMNLTFFHPFSFIAMKQLLLGFLFIVLVLADRDFYKILGVSRYTLSTLRSFS